MCSYLKDGAQIAAPAESVLGAINGALAELGIEPGYPCTPAVPLTPRAASSPVWLRMLGIAAQGRNGKAIDLAARPAVDGDVGIEQRLGQIVRALAVLVAEIRRRGIEGWLEMDAQAAHG